jgi:hypothetical protein
MCVNFSDVEQPNKNAERPSDPPDRFRSIVSFLQDMNKANLIS